MRLLRQPMDQATFPFLLRSVATLSLVAGVLSALVILINEIRRPQKMWVMNVVWPLTALFGSILWLAAYYAWGRKVHAASTAEDTPFAIAVFKGSSHCGAGCTLGDVVAEWLAFFVPSLAVWFGWQSLFKEKMFAVWIPDFILAFAFGILIQYFTIKPMHDISVREDVVRALQADAASIMSWQVGMYGAMVLIQFLWFRAFFGGTAPVDSIEFWFAMQLAMLAGFCTSYPVNWLLIRYGVKERM